MILHSLTVRLINFVFPDLGQLFSSCSAGAFSISPQPTPLIFRHSVTRSSLGVCRGQLIS
uniref:Uncharacterized protein n=1 Tax=Octopus bimaculoides TaxID=37653 RepID=A0A0L8GI83_OCTBM